MVKVDNTLRLPEFQGVVSEDSKQSLFVYDMILAKKNVHDQAVNIVLVWYMKL